MLWFFFFGFFVLLCFYKISVLLKSGATQLDYPHPPPVSNTPIMPSSSGSYSHDVFLSFRGEDTRKTFVDHLYSALERQLIQTYKDDIKLPRGESVGPALLEAIEESHIAVIIFSKKYANSSWCLDELVHIMKCRAEKGQIVMPVFYDVDPSDVRKQKGEFGKAFAKQEAENVTKAESWRKALVDASNISGWEPKNVSNGHEAAVIQKIVDAISDKLLSSNYSNTNEKLVGMTDRVNNLISKLEIGTGGVRMVGIWGVGGGGKTTLATSVYMKIKDHFRGHCIVSNIREESSKSGIATLQEKILSSVLKTQARVQSEEEGKHLIESRLCRSNVLIILDDVDDCTQLEALAGSHSWFGDGSRILITTRDEHLLQKVDYVSHVMLLSKEEGKELFRKYAYNHKMPLKEYEKLSLCVVSYAHGLPLALRVLGSFLYDKDEKEWRSTLDKLKQIPGSEIVEKLKISYDGLKKEEKELFLDIACFFRGEIKESRMDILEAFGFHPDIGIKVLIQKALITINSYGEFDMHDLVQEMGHYIVRGEHPNNPAKHTRVWKREEINYMCLEDTTMENDKTEVIYPPNIDDGNQLLYLKMVSNMKKLRWLIVKERNHEVPTSLSTELRCIEWDYYPASRFPNSFQLTNLGVLKMEHGLQTKLWKGCKLLPRLKVLQLKDMQNLVSTPDFDGLPSLQKLTISNCDKLEEMHPSLGNNKSLKYIKVECFNLRKFPKIDHMKKLENLQISGYFYDFEIPEIQTDMENLAHLSFSSSRQVVFLSSVAVHCPNLISLKRHLFDHHGSLNHVSKLDFNLSKHTMLVYLDLSGCSIEKLPEFPSSLVIFKADYCDRLKDIGDVNRNCKWLCQVSVIEGGILNDGDRLLRSMLQGKVIENHSMVLYLEGLQIPRMFRPRLRDGNKCRLQLPENWCNDFCGFLICAVLKHGTFIPIGPEISMKPVRGGLMGIDFEDDDDWKESVDDKQTWVGYVSFGSLRHKAAWLDETCKALSFSIPPLFLSDHYELCRGFGVSLIPSTSGSGPSDDTSPPQYYSYIGKKKYNFKPELEIEDDLTCIFNIPSPV